jgi:hypothetical protein
MEAPIKLTTSGRGKLTTCFAGEDLCSGLSGLTILMLFTFSNLVTWV